MSSGNSLNAPAVRIHCTFCRFLGYFEICKLIRPFATWQTHAFVFSSSCFHALNLGVRRCVTVLGLGAVAWRGAGRLMASSDLTSPLLPLLRINNTTSTSPARSPVDPQTPESPLRTPTHESGLLNRPARHRLPDLPSDESCFSGSPRRRRSQGCCDSHGYNSSLGPRPGPSRAILHIPRLSPGCTAACLDPRQAATDRPLLPRYA
jgi:hypothetical protein